MNLPIDSYTLRARIFPAFLLFLPLALAVTAWAPEANIPAFAICGISVNVAISFFVAERVRDIGKKREKELWKSWGGTPTTQLLRHRNPDISPQLRDIWRDSIEKNFSISLPSSSSESRSPDKADAAYEAAIFRLRERTREAEKYPLVFKENVSYGFRRNLWALKPTGIFLSIISTMICTLRAGVANLSNGTVESHSSLALVACVILLVWWLLAITKTWVRTVAFEYAKRLIGASISISDSASAP